MFFTPFAFIQSSLAPATPGISLQGYYIGGGFTTYATNNNPFFRALTISGSISSSFNIGAGFSADVYAFVTQSDEKIIVGGNFTSYSGSAISRLVRLNTDGTRDTTFNVGTGLGGLVASIAIQSDGKAVVGGQFTTYSGSAQNRLTRVNTNGTRDTTFNIGTGFGSNVNAVAVQPDGKIIVVGAFTSYSGSTKNYIVRLNTDGTADTGSSWNQGNGFSITANAISLQSDGKIVVGGSFANYSGSTALRIVRINSNGTLDTSFNTGAGFDNTVNTTAIQSDSKILAGGAFTTYSGSAAGGIIRLNTDGTRDITFNPGAGTVGAITNMYIQSDGKILLQGNLANYSGSIISTSTFRINSDGTLDTTFNATPSTNNALTVGNSLIQLSNQSILIGGSFTGPRVGYFTFANTSGNPTQRSILESYGFDSNIVESLPLSGSKLLNGGGFLAYSGSVVNRLVLIDTNGTRDTSFNIGTGFNNTIATFATQSDGKIVIGGVFTTYSGSSINRIIRLNTDGTIDTSFNVGTGVDGTNNNVIIQNDQKIIAAGLFNSYSGSSSQRITRINTNGTRDASFNVGVGFNGAVSIKGLAIQSDGKIIAGGAFATFSGSTANGIIRINTDGTRDTSFNIGTGLSGLGSTSGFVAIQNDQKIVVGGNFSIYSGSSSTRIVRINTDGTRDTTFNPGSGLNGIVLVVRVQDDGKILVGGQFTTYSGSTANRIVRINTNGTLDATFIPTGSGFNTSINTIVPYYAES
jgi:uncharacterized delta-60 repeat protein